MTVSCSEVKTTLESGGGAVDVGIAGHLAGCPECRAHAAILDVLGRLEPRQGNAEEVNRILTDLPFAAWQFRRVSTWAPLVGGVGLTAGGLALLGGVPAGSAFSNMVSGAGEALGWSIGSRLDAAAALRGATDAVRALVAAGGASLIVWLVFAGLGSGWVARALARQRAGRNTA
jgi:hypothetical protein